jgi:hypothetical protein
MSAEEEENKREVMEEQPVNPEELAVEKVSYEKEQERTEPTSFILFKSTHELISLGMNTKELDPHTSRVQSIRPVGTDSNPSKKKNKGTEIQQLYQPLIPFPQRLAKAKLDERFQKFM